MKILVIGSTSRSLINFRGKMLQSFVEKGHQVFAAAPDDDPNVISVLKKWGVSFKRVYIDRTGTHPIKDIKSLVSLYRVIRSIKPDIVLTYTIKPVVYGSTAAYLAGVKRIYSMITGLGNLFNNNKGVKASIFHSFGGLLYWMTGRVNKKIIFQNPDDREFFIKNKIVPAAKTAQINGSGVDLGRFGFHPPQLEPIRFLFIGRFLKEKGMVEFFEAAKILKNEHPSVEFLVAGKLQPNSTNEIRKVIEKEMRREIVAFLGYYQDIRIAIKNASVFVLPSFYREGTPRTALESMAMGRPIITTDAPGCRETVINGHNGFLVTPQSIIELTSAMKKFINEPNLIPEMGLNSRIIAECKFDVEKVNKEILSILNIL